MGFLGNIIKAFSEAAKAGSDFNPALQGLLEQLDALHSEGKLGEVVYKAEQAYISEHGEYTAKGIHTNAADSQNDVKALAHFMAALKSEKEQLDPSVKAQAEKVLDMQDKMSNILGNILKK